MIGEKFYFTKTEMELDVLNQMNYYIEFFKDSKFGVLYYKEFDVKHEKLYQVQWKGETK